MRQVLNPKFTPNLTVREAIHMTENITIRVDGKPVAVSAGTTVAAAILNSGHSSFRRSIEGEPRGPVCGMGICFECRVTIDGQAHARSCLIEARDGMVIET